MAKNPLPRRRWWRCYDCRRDVYKLGHYYTVSAETWAASGLAPDGGQLCLECLEHRLGRLLKFGDFTWIKPDGWPAHVDRRSSPRQLELPLGR